jgi:hypothetical protein
MLYDSASASTCSHAFKSVLASALARASTSTYAFTFTHSSTSFGELCFYFASASASASTSTSTIPSGMCSRSSSSIDQCGFQGGCLALCGRAGVNAGIVCSKQANRCPFIVIERLLQLCPSLTKLNLHVQMNTNGEYTHSSPCIHSDGQTPQSSLKMWRMVPVDQKTL